MVLYTYQRFESIHVCAGLWVTLSMSQLRAQRVDFSEVTDPRTHPTGLRDHLGTWCSVGLTQHDSTGPSQEPPSHVTASHAA